QAEDGIRDRNVTGVQTCALPIYSAAEGVERQVVEEELGAVFEQQRHAVSVTIAGATVVAAQPLDLRTHLRVRVLDPVGMIGAVRSEERRVGKEWRARSARGE